MVNNMRKFIWFFVIITLGYTTPVFAQVSVNDWIAQIDRQSPIKGFSGSYVSVDGDKIQSLKIVQQYDSETNRYQQLISPQNGRKATIYSDGRQTLVQRDNGKIHPLPSSKVSISSLMYDLPERLSEIQESYVLELKNKDRVVDRMAQKITIMPKDQYRYGYALWVDEASGLVLRASQIHNKEVLAQFIFTDIQLEPPKEEGLWANFETYLANHSFKKKSQEIDLQPDWQANDFLGFKVIKHTKEYLQGKRQIPVEVIVFSDGLANISVFIEDLPKTPKPLLVGYEKRGALTALGAVYNNSQFMSFGDVPVETLKRCIESIKHLKSDGQVQAPQFGKIPKPPFKPARSDQ